MHCSKCHSTNVHESRRGRLKLFAPFKLLLTVVRCHTCDHRWITWKHSVRARRKAA